MYLIQIFLPLYDNNGRAISQARFNQIATELSEHFGGLTAYTRAPAEGFWKKRGKRTKHDDMVVYEVMSSRLQRRWWQFKRAELQKLFRQQEILIRAQVITRL